MNGVERHYQVCKLSYVFRKLLERAIKVDAAMINLVTWNDYAEGHHLAPEINHNFGFALLLRYYRNRWQGRQDNNRREEAIVFFKKYRHDVKPQPYAFRVRAKKAAGEESDEDAIEVVTILNRSANLTINGKSMGRVDAGLQVRRIPSEPGRVRVQISREGKAVIDFTTPEAITNKPYRTDRFTYAYSSEFGRIFRELFGDTKPLTSSEYGGAQ